MIKIYYPNYSNKQINWVFKVIFNEFLGVSYKATSYEGEDFLIEINGGTILLKNDFFSKSEKRWLSTETLPKQPLKLLNLSELNMFSDIRHQEIPIIYGDEGVTISENEIKINLDIFGSVFFMLSRYEETIARQKDQYDRFSAKSSIAYQESFLERAIVNEYIDILWIFLCYFSSTLERKKHKYEIAVSADVDEPYSYSTKSIPNLIRRLGGDIIKRRSLHAIKGTLDNYFKAKKGNYESDPFFPYFKWMMDINESLGNKMAFYFLVKNRSKIDGYYTLEEPVIRNLIREIISRGHEIGLHSSFDSYLDKQKIIDEVTITKRLLKDNGLLDDYLGSRQHYLRWKNPETPRNLNLAKVNYDASVGFADYIGFRSGTCYQYSFFDVKKLLPMDLIIRPLVFMDVSLSGYMGLDYDDKALVKVEYLKDTCRFHNGTFTVLWHNSQLYEIEAREFYKKIIS